MIIRLNNSTSSIPYSLFYANNRVLLIQDLALLRYLADLLTEWSTDAGIAVNVKKCRLVLGHGVALKHMPNPVLISNKPLPIVESYTYLGFPMRSDRIDFLTYLSKRLT